MQHVLQQVHDARELSPAPAALTAPPAWAVLAVKCCVIGLLLLPVATLLWVVAFPPTPERDLGPIAFGVALLLGIGMAATVATLTSAYPPVRPPPARDGRAP